MSGLRERVEDALHRLEAEDPLGMGGTDGPAARIRQALDADPPAPQPPWPAAEAAIREHLAETSTADAPADTTLRVQIARWLCEYRFGSNAWEKASDVRRSMALSSADALLPLLRVHAAQVAAQARRDALNEALDAVLARADDGIEFGPSNYLLLVRIVADVRRAVSPQPARDQAHDETRQG